MIQTSKSPDCRDERLQELLVVDEDSAEFRATSVHVESCAFCQRRLAQLAATEEQWEETRSHLGHTDELDALPRFDRDSPLRHEERTRPLADSLSLDFLSPPSHPEMLGRIGRYEIEKVIGTGGMGIVLKGHDGELNRPVAIKVLAPHLAHNGAARQRFAREGRAAAAVVHEHVVPIHGVEPEADLPFLVMHYVPGRSLQARVDDGGPLPVDEILRIGIQTASGLAAAHAQGVIHRDIKPSNILLEDTVDRVLISDFGLARAADDASLTQTGILAGTPHYMSPEQASGDSIDPRSDLFSLGAVLFFMATGRPPFRAEKAMAVLNRICTHRHRSVRDINVAVPHELSEIIDRLLEKKPRHRFSDAAELQTALSRLLANLQRPGSHRWAANVGRWFRRKRRAVAVATALSVLTGVALYFQPARDSDLATGDSDTPARKGQAAVSDEFDVKQPGDSAEQTGREANKLERPGMAESRPMSLSDEFEALHVELQRVEQSHYGRSHAFMHADDPWSSEIQQIRQRLTQVEDLFEENPLPGE